MKWLGTVLVIGGCGGYGLYLLYLKKCRIFYLRTFAQSLKNISEELRVLHTTLPEIFLSMAKGRDDNLAVFYQELSKQLCSHGEIPFLEIWKETVEKKIHVPYLKQTDISLLKSVGEFPLYLDYTAGIAFLERKSKELEITAQEANTVLKEKQRLYQSGGFLIGGVLVLLFL